MRILTLISILRARFTRIVHALRAQNHLELFPVKRTLRHYSLHKLKTDLNAGFNSALFAFPQGIAYSLIAGLPVAYGVFGSAIAGVVCGIWSRSAFLILGPTNTTSVMLASSFAAMGISAPLRAQNLPLLLVLVGLILILGAFAKAANLIQYISRSVITGYMTAAAALIMATQLEDVLGVHYSEQATTFYQVINLAAVHLDELAWASLGIGVLTLLIYRLLDRYFTRLPNLGITILLLSCVGIILEKVGIHVEFLSSVNFSNWSLTLPSFDLWTLSRMASAALALAVLCSLETTSVGKSLAARAGQRFDTNQELLTLGLANCMCAVGSGMVASASPTRSTLSWKCGASTPLSGCYSGLFCLIGIFVLGTLVSFIPQATLAALIMVFGFHLINKHAIEIVVRSTRADAIVFSVTLISGLLLPLDSAVYFGIVASIALFLRKAAMPEMAEYVFNEAGQLTELEHEHKRPHAEISIVHVEGNLFFGAAEIFQEQMRRVCEDRNLKVVILKMRNAYHLDATSVMALEELVQSMRDNNRTLLVSEVRKDVLRIFKKSGLRDLIGRDHIFPDNLQNPTLSTAQALRKAQSLAGSEQARISILVDAKESLL